MESVKATRNPRTHLEPGDLLFYCSNHKVNLKRCVVFKGDPSRVHCQHNLIRLRFYQQGVEPHFMALMINAIFESSWFKASGQSTARITMRKLRTLPMLFPPYEEQIHIVAFLKSTLGIVKTHVDVLLEQEKHLHTLKEKILNQFFERAF
jgi:restriction endonuclease S subunit